MCFSLGYVSYRHLKGTNNSKERSLCFLPLSDPVSSTGPPDGSWHFPVKPAKLDATAFNDCTLAATVPSEETSNHAVVACHAGVHEEHYISEAVENDAPGYREYRDAGTITGMYY